MKIFNHQTALHLKNKLITPSLISLTLLISANCNAALISDLYISEVMANPNTVSDSNGEWFEIYNPTEDPFDFNNITLSDAGSNTHLISDTQPLIINSGEYFVFGKNAYELENGGYTPDYVYSNFTLSNTEDEIILTDLLGHSLMLAYTSGFTSPGKSTELLSTDMSLVNYAFTRAFSYGGGDYGTPGSKGTYDFNAVTVPEPSTLWLALIGCLIFMYQMRQRKHVNKLSAPNTEIMT